MSGPPASRTTRRTPPRWTRGEATPPQKEACRRGARVMPAATGIKILRAWWPPGARRRRHRELRWSPGTLKLRGYAEGQERPRPAARAVERRAFPTAEAGRTPSCSRRGAALNLCPPIGRSPRNRATIGQRLADARCYEPPVTSWHTPPKVRAV